MMTLKQYFKKNKITANHFCIEDVFYTYLNCDIKKLDVDNDFREVCTDVIYSTGFFYPSKAIEYLEKNLNEYYAYMDDIKELAGDSIDITTLASALNKILALIEYGEIERKLRNAL
jgi:hypothetical protein